MGKSWDAFVPQPVLWNECLRVLKPGGHLLSFAGTRTYDLVVLGLRLSGFEIRDQLAWVYGSGMPKALDVSKAIDKELGAERAIIGEYDPRSKFDGIDRSSNAINYNWRNSEDRTDTKDNSIKTITEPATEEAKQWDGWKSSLKPAQEPIVMARKPLEGTIAQNVLKWHTGALNIDACRVPIETGDTKQATAGVRTVDENGNGWGISQSGSSYVKGTGAIFTDVGRFPSNFIHDGSDEVTSLFPDSNGAGKSLPQVKITGYGDKNTGTGKADYIGGDRIPFDAGSGSAARFFYCAKASKSDRMSGCEDLPEGNNHPTLKPTSLMSWLVTLVTPPNGIVLDPFNGSGSTGKAAMINGFKYIGIDLSQDYIDISKRRIQHAYTNKETIKKELTNKVNGDKVKPVEKSSDKESSLIDLFRE
jgi:site-specific DNA-methyltransferase (adenine-specific)